MSNHKNCFELVKEVRYGVNEYDDALATGDDVIGGYKNPYIITIINQTIRELYAMIARRRSDEFQKEASLVAVDSVITLPSDFSVLILLRDADGLQVNPIAQIQRRLTDWDGSEHLYYKQGRTLVIDKKADTGTYSLIYKSKPRDIHQGKASAGGALSITLAASEASTTADFYNGMTIEDITQGWADVITDYSTGRVATILQTAAAEDFYALVPEIPEWAHHLISPRATILCKLNPISREKPSKDEIEAYREMLLSAFRENATPEEDTDYEAMFFRPEPKSYGSVL